MSSTKKLRACLLCSFVASPAEFRKQGCPNCEDKLEVRLIVLALLLSTSSERTN